MNWDDLKSGIWVAVREVHKPWKGYPLGVPLRVKGVALPFIVVYDLGRDGHFALNLDRCLLVRLTKEYVRAFRDGLVIDGIKDEEESKSCNVCVMCGDPMDRYVISGGFYWKCSKCQPAKT